MKNQGKKVEDMLTFTIPWMRRMLNIMWKQAITMEEIVVPSSVMS